MIPISELIELLEILDDSIVIVKDASTLEEELIKFIKQNKDCCKAGCFNKG